MPFPNQPEPKPAERRVADSLPSAILLAFTGGSLDAFVYLNHGHVFAAAMTGNGVLFGIAILHRDLSQAIRHVLPILAFLFGAFTAKSLDNHLKQRAVTVGLLCEIAVLFAASWLPGSFPDLAFVPLIAVVAAYQITSFRTAEHYAYNSTFMTGNLRSAVDGLYAHLSASTLQDRQAGLRQFHALSLLVAAFMSGAIAGALLAPRMLNRTLWIIDVPLIAVLALVLKRSRNRRVKGPGVEEYELQLVHDTNFCKGLSLGGRECLARSTSSSLPRNLSNAVPKTKAAPAYTLGPPHR